MDVRWWLCSAVSRLLVTPWTAAHQAPLSMGFSRQEYWSGSPFSSSRGSSWPRDRTHISCVSCTGSQILHHCTTREATGQGTLKGLQHHISKVAERRRIDAFKLWCWRRLLRVPGTVRRSTLKIHLEGLMLKLKLQYFGHLRQRADSLEKTRIPRKTEGKRRRGW